MIAPLGGGLGLLELIELLAELAEKGALRCNGGRGDHRGAQLVQGEDEESPGLEDIQGGLQLGGDLGGVACLEELAGDENMAHGLGEALELVAVAVLEGHVREPARSLVPDVTCLVAGLDLGSKGPHLMQPVLFDLLRGEQVVAQTGELIGDLIGVRSLGAKLTRGRDKSGRSHVHR